MKVSSDTFFIFSFFFERIYMKCLRCHNTDPKLFGYDKGIFYCRKCISFSRIDLNTKINPCSLSHSIYHITPQLSFQLTSKQQEASHQVKSYLSQGYDVFLYCATGAGKTEICYESICWYLSKGYKVGFSISRRQVVLEIKDRLQSVFPSLHVVAVTQGYTQETDGDIIVCTMHQLFRYPYGFDLLIMDEVDAFPYVGNDVLQSIADISCKGQKLYLSATPDDYSLKMIKENKMKEVRLFQRPHGYPLTVPKVFILPKVFQILLLLYYLQKWKSKQCIVFVPKKEDTIWMHFLLLPFISNKGIHSKSKNQDLIISQFRKKKFNCLISTTLLERGITIPDVQVIVYDANHSVFTTSSLIQIYGRIGRSMKNPKGEGICLCDNYNKSIKDCINQLKMMNHSV